jgi:hypothetical protein
MATDITVTPAETPSRRCGTTRTSSPMPARAAGPPESGPLGDFLETERLPRPAPTYAWGKMRPSGLNVKRNSGPITTVSKCAPDPTLGVHGIRVHSAANPTEKPRPR